jgi:Single-stranded DNA-specific exonuclease
VAKGLIAMRRRENVGLTALIDVARLSGPPEPWHLGFMLGPRINAGGRIGRADLGARLLIEDDATECARIATELDRLNRERQAIEQATLAQAEAEAMAALGHDHKGAVVVTAAEGWHPGVVGLVAARLKERYGRPAFAIALEPGEYGTGSGRSIAGVDLGRAVRHAVAEGLLVKGGGHAMAAGVTLRKSGLAAFRAFLEETLRDAVETARRDEALLIDGAVTAAGAGFELYDLIARAGPFGAGNPEPILALPSHTVAYAEDGGQGHIRVRLKAGEGVPLAAIAFRVAGEKLGEALLAARGRRVHVAGTLALDRWQGTERAQLKIIDLAPAEEAV